MLQILVMAACAAGQQLHAAAPEWLRTGQFRWQPVKAPVAAPAARTDDPCHAIKDPTVVRFENRWHLFSTIRSQKRSHQIEYMSFEDWNQADRAERHILRVTDGYFCAPQVFFFTPHQQWYLVYQASDPTRKPQLQPVFSTSKRIGDPNSWTRPTLLFEKAPNIERWIDFWIICDDGHAHLFFTSLDGKMWRSETKLDRFPHDFSQPVVVLTGDIFEASHTYRLKGLNQYLTIVEAQDNGRRYYKAYRADSLRGDWKPLADLKTKPFAARSANISFADEPGWTDSISHGEILRAGHDEKLEIDPYQITFLFQGVSDRDRQGKQYGEIPWKLGLATLQIAQ